MPDDKKKKRTLLEDSIRRSGYGYSEEDIKGSEPSMQEMMNKGTLKAPDESTFYIPGHEKMHPEVLNQLLQDMIKKRRQDYYNKLNQNK